MSSVYVWMFRLKCLGLEGQQEDCSMFEVPVRRNCGRRNSSWFVEQSVDQSARNDAGSWRQMCCMVVLRLYVSSSELITNTPKDSLYPQSYNTEFGVR